MNFELVRLETSKRAYMKACHLVMLMEKYSKSLSLEDEESLRNFASITDGMPLPSGRWGNAIALALEINDYVSAKYLIENAKELNLETNKVVSELGGENPWGLKDEFSFSLLTFKPFSESEINELKTIYSEDRIQKIIEDDNKQLSAIESIEKELSSAKKSTRK